MPYAFPRGNVLSPISNTLLTPQYPRFHIYGIKWLLVPPRSTMRWGSYGPRFLSFMGGKITAHFLPLYKESLGLAGAHLHICQFKFNQLPEERFFCRSWVCSNSQSFAQVCICYTINSIDRFARLVNTPEGMVAFRTQYRILNSIELQHCELGEWLVMNRPPGSVVIPMIAFIEGGMEILMGRVTKDFLMNYRLTPTQYSLNVFRVLECVDMINRKMGTNFT